MINIYKYKDADKLRITAVNNEIYEGLLVSVNDAEDEDEDYGLKENSITIAVEGAPITFTVSDIKNIDIVK